MISWQRASASRIWRLKESTSAPQSEMEPSRMCAPLLNRGSADGALGFEADDGVGRVPRLPEHLVGVLAVLRGAGDEGRPLVELQRRGHELEGRPVVGLHLD